MEVMGLMERLAQVRPVFHSEADFRHALAWKIQIDHRTRQSVVRLETRPTPGVRLDVLIRLGHERITDRVRSAVDPH